VSNATLGPRKSRKCAILFGAKYGFVAELFEVSASRSMIRDGLAIRAADQKLVLEGFDPGANGVLDHIAQTLSPDEPNHLSAELYAVNLYGPGGHFAQHMLGTLVVCLPWPFGGGALELAAGERRVVVDFSSAITNDSSSLHCAAFFGDVDHAVHEVTRGMRVTLSFLVRRSARKSTPARRAAGTRNETGELAAALAALAKDPEVARAGLALRFPCTHHYIATRDTLAVQPIADVDATQALKGRDALVARAALEAELQVSLAYFLWAADDDGIALDARLDEPLTAKKLEKLRRLVRRSSASEEGSFSEADLWDEIGAAETVATRVVGLDRSRAAHVGSGNYSATGFYGNEASAAEFYVGAAIDVLVPKHGAAAARRPLCQRA
jgi:hypothetical protein